MDGRRKLWIGIGAGLLVALAILVIGVLSLDRDEPGSSQAAPAQEAAAGEQAPDPEAVTTFGDNCGQCHTLTVAGTDGDVGPNLDGIEYDRERVLAAIENGGRGSGAMAPNLIEGEQAEIVAELIADDEPVR